jgi:hypothetical protein
MAGVEAGVMLPACTKNPAGANLPDAYPSLSFPALESPSRFEADAMPLRAASSSQRPSSLA